MATPPYTRGTLRTSVLQQADAVGSARWDSTAGGEVDAIINMVFNREWKRILNANRFYQMQDLQITTDPVTGRIPISSLSSGTGDTKQNFYRILTIIYQNIVYDPAKYTEIPLGETFASNVNIFYQEGQNILILPKILNVTVDIKTNWYPVAPGNLSADGVLINFPTDYQDILRYEAAAWMLSKGGAETQASKELQGYAELIRTDLLQDVARLTTDTDQVEYPDSRFNWGGS